MPEDKQRSWRWWWALAWRFLLVVALAALFAVIWWKVPPALYRDSGGGLDAENARLKAVTDTRTALLAGLIGVGALLTFWLNSRVYRITSETLAVTKQGQITERYAKAIEQLGSQTLDVRLGSIYALERITHDSRRDQDQATIVEVLSAFVRVHSDPVYRLRRHLAEPTRPDWKDGESPQKEEAFQEGERPRQRELRLAEEHVAEFPLPVDVQVAVTVLGRLPHRPSVLRADLAGAHLAKADLAGADLEGANLLGANLARANLSEAHLERANLLRADLEGANLYGAHLVRADLTVQRGPEYSIQDPSRFANLKRANLTKAHLEQTDLAGALLEQGSLSGVHLEGATLREAHLEGAWLYNAHLERAELSEAHLQGAQLPGAQLQGANLKGAQLQRANLKGAQLQGANLDGAVLVTARADEATSWPSGFDWRAAGVVIEEAAPQRLG
jgi:uncharacterized protein YjbI with pentapeptide repeats